MKLTDQSECSQQTDTLEGGYGNLIGRYYSHLTQYWSFNDELPVMFILEHLYILQSDSPGFRADVDLFK